MEAASSFLTQYAESFKSALEAMKSQFQIHKAIFKLVSKGPSGNEEL